MRHFVSYHNFERMEQESTDENSEAEESAGEVIDDGASSSSEEEEFPYGQLTRKKPDRFLGYVIWGIQGQAKPREY